MPFSLTSHDVWLFAFRARHSAAKYDFEVEQDYAESSYKAFTIIVLQMQVWEISIALTTGFGRKLKSNCSRHPLDPH